MNELKTCIIFFAGAGIGAAVAWKLTCKHYESIIDEEIESVKRVYSQDDVKKFLEENAEELSTDEFVTLVRDYSGVKKEEPVKEDTPTEENDIYRISDNEFIEGKPTYDKITITRYADGYYADDEGCLMEAGECVGLHTFDDIPEGFDGVEYVRNDYLNVDYEVIFSNERYSETLREEG